MGWRWSALRLWISHTVHVFLSKKKCHLWLLTLPWWACVGRKNIHLITLHHVHGLWWMLIMHGLQTYGPESCLGIPALHIYTLQWFKKKKKTPTHWERRGNEIQIHSPFADAIMTPNGEKWFATNGETYMQVLSPLFAVQSTHCPDCWTNRSRWEKPAWEYMRSQKQKINQGVIQSTKFGEIHHIAVLSREEVSADSSVFNLLWHWKLDTCAAKHEMPEVCDSFGWLMSLLQRIY